MRAILGSLSLVLFLAYPVLGGISYGLQTGHGLSSAHGLSNGYSNGFAPVYSHPSPEIYSSGTNGLISTTVAPFIDNGLATTGLGAAGLGAAGLGAAGFGAAGFGAADFGATGFGGLGYGAGDLGIVGGYGGVEYGAFPETIVSKHFTYHTAPEEAPEIKVRHLALGQPQKSYRVVFIKAPAQNPPITRLTASFAPKEEKTVIYVLSKKPETALIDEIVQPPATEPSKPEVVFVKYKTPEEADHAQRTIQAQYDAIGGSTQVSDEGVAPLTSVVGSLGQTDSVVGSLGYAGSNVGGLGHAGSVVGGLGHAGSIVGGLGHAGSFVGGLGHAGSFVGGLGHAGSFVGDLGHTTEHSFLDVQPTTDDYLHVLSTRSPKDVKAKAAAAAARKRS